MTFALPALPEPDGATPRLISTRNELRSAVGGNLKRIGRKGSRYAFDFVMPRMGYSDSLAFIRLRSEDGLVSIRVPQHDLEIGTPGAVIRVNGAGQAGASLDADGFTPAYAMRQGQLLTHFPVTGPRRIYCCVEEAQANDLGQMTIPLETMLGVPPSDGDLIEVGDPTIEGFAIFDPSIWTTDFAREVGLSFSIEEPGDG